jgi:uncharacterized delta-60 repeat protein
MVTVERLESRRLLSASHVPVPPAGSLDPTFGVEGTNQVDALTAPFSTTPPAAVQPDGKLIIFGGGVSRMNPDGSLDPTFGNGGSIQLPGTPSGPPTATSAALQSDGRIVVGASIPALTGRGGGELLRLTPDGKLDPTFGASGIVTTNILIQAVTIDPAGNIVVAGERNPFTPPSGSVPGEFEMARYRVDGTLDSNFGTGGTVLLDNPNGVTEAGATALALQPNGRIVGMGLWTQDSMPNRIIVYGFNSDGTLDPTFGGGRPVQTDLPSSDIHTSQVVIQPAGRIVLISSPGEIGLWLEGLRRDGTRDRTFGHSGRTIVATGFSPAFSASGEIAVPLARYIRSIPNDIFLRSDYQLSVRWLTVDGRVDPHFREPVKQAVEELLEWENVRGVFTENGNLLLGWGNDEFWRVLGRPTPAFAKRTGGLVTVYATDPMDQISIQNATPAGVRVTVNSQSGVFLGKRVRIVWPGHGVLRRVPMSVSGTLQELFSIYAS